MARRGKEGDTCHKGDQVVANEIDPELRAIKYEPNAYVDEKDS